MFSRFLLFFASGRRGGLCVAEAGRRGFGARITAKPCSSVFLAPSPGAFSVSGRRELGARFPAKPCSSVPLHQVWEPFRRAAGADLVHDSPQSPVPPFPLHQVRVPFRRPAGAWPAHRRPSGIRSHHYKSQRERIDDERPISPPSSSILIISSCPCSNLHSTSQKLTTDPRFSAVCRQFLPLSTGIAEIRDSQESCCSPSRFHPIKTPSRKKEGVFNSYAESIRLRRDSGCSRRSDRYSSHVARILTLLEFSCYSLPRPVPRPATRRRTSVSFISSDTIMPNISSNFSTSSSGKRFRIRWQTMLM